MAAEEEWRTALEELVEQPPSAPSERRKLGFIVMGAFLASKSEQLRQLAASLEREGKRSHDSERQEVAGNPDEWTRVLLLMLRSGGERIESSQGKCRPALDAMDRRGLVSSSACVAGRRFVLAPAGRRAARAAEARERGDMLDDEDGDTSAVASTTPAPPPVANDTDPVCVACHARPPREQDAFCSSGCAEDFPELVVSALAAALELEDSPNVPLASRRFVGTWPVKVQVAVLGWVQALGAAACVAPEHMLQIDREMDDRSRAAVGDFRALFVKGAEREISAGGAAAIDADRLARMDERARNLGFEDATDMVAKNTGTPRGADALAELRKGHTDCTLRDIERTIEMRPKLKPIYGASVSDAIVPATPPPEEYDRCVAAGTWPLGYSKSDAERYWEALRSPAITAKMFAGDATSAVIDGDGWEEPKRWVITRGKDSDEAVLEHDGTVFSRPSYASVADFFERTGWQPKSRLGLQVSLMFQNGLRALRVMKIAEETRKS